MSSRLGEPYLSRLKRARAAATGIEAVVALTDAAHNVHAAVDNHEPSCEQLCGDTFTCAGCSLSFGACMGEDDDHPDLCDRCAVVARLKADMEELTKAEIEQLKASSVPDTILKIVRAIIDCVHPDDEIATHEGSDEMGDHLRRCLLCGARQDRGVWFPPTLIAELVAIAGDGPPGDRASDYDDPPLRLSPEAYERWLARLRGEEPWQGLEGAKPDVLTAKPAVDDVQQDAVAQLTNLLRDSGLVPYLHWPECAVWRKGPCDKACASRAAAAADPVLELRVLVDRDGPNYCARALEIWFMEEAATIEEAMDNFQKSLCDTVVEHVQRTGDIEHMDLYPRPPIYSEFHKLLRSGSWTSVTRPLHASPLPYNAIRFFTAKKN